MCHSVLLNKSKIIVVALFLIEGYMFDHIEQFERTIRSFRKS